MMEKSLLQVQAPRTDLMELLNKLSGKRNIYIHAPAGYGKTVSASLWAEQNFEEFNRAFISLDEFDNKTSEFSKRFMTALLRLQPENNKLRELVTHASHNTASIESIIHALSEFSESKDGYVIVVDDLHNISKSEILKILPFLCRRLPQNCTILFLSRSVPPDSFSEMISKDDLALVDAAQLQFTAKEIKNFFDKNGHRITNKQADEIMTSTGGWAIGIRALLVSGKNAFNFDLSDRYLEIYLKTHIWDKWDDKLKRFMMLVSVADELTPELCKWLTSNEQILKNTSVSEILDRLIVENAFIRETGTDTYKFHDLFREFLTNMMKELGEDIVNRQWNRAGEYFYKKEDYFRAVENYTKGKNDDGVANSLYNMYDYRSLAASIGDTTYIISISVNDSIIEKHPFLLEVKAWADFVEGRSDDFEETLDKYYKKSAKIILKNPRSAIILVLLKCLDYRRDFINTIKTLRMLPFKGIIRAPTPSITQNMPFFHRSFRDLSDIMFDIEKNMRIFNNNIGVFFGEEYSVMQECLYAGIFYEQGQISEAHEHAMAACANIQSKCSAEIKFNAMMILLVTLYAGKQYDEAEILIEDIHKMVEDHKAFYLETNLNAFIVRRKMWNGDRDAALEWLKDHDSEIPDTLNFFDMYSNYTNAMAYVVLGLYNKALLLTHKIHKQSENYRRPSAEIETLILLSIIYWKKGQDGRGQTLALESLTKAVIIAHKYGYSQVFVTYGADLVTMLHRLQKRAVQSSYSGELPADFIKILYIAAVSGSKIAKGLTGGELPAKVTFTDKQKEVMRLMCEGCSRNEIAKRMGLKPNGVISHTTLIYKKLDVSSSIDAVLKIKELGLL
ncbi:MAG: LuxR C-terminal-related transcriptional regulator [Oscillospiraceae bacterium]|nr:LuxR C-terminal-related transcriptional regulator [Oscillospiraceae bacterium]